MNISKLVDYLDELDIHSKEKLKAYIKNNSIDVIEEFVKYARKLVSQDWERSEYSPFLFVPSLDLSGAGGCSTIECKEKRAKNFAKYCALYCDRAYIYLESITSPHVLSNYENEGLSSAYKQDIFADFSLILIYSKLINENIVKIVPSNFSLCKDCFTKNFTDHKDTEKLKELINQYSNEAEIVFDAFSAKDNIGLLTVQNLPQIFQDHGHYMRYVGGPVLDEFRKFSRFPSKLENEEIIHQIIESVVLSEYNDIKFETFMSKEYNAKFISSHDASRSIINTITYGKEIPSKEALPIYDMPIIKNASIDTILKIRKNEEDAFNQYRISLANAIDSHYIGQSSIEIKEIYDDFVYPSFVQLNNSLNKLTRRNIYKTIGNIAVIGSTVTLGILTNIVPSTTTGVLSAIGGATLLSPFISTAIDYVKEKDAAKNNDYYFLWKLDQEN